MKITYCTGIKKLEPKSMEVYRVNLIRELKKIDPHLYLLEHLWNSPTDFNIPRFHFDREFYRYILYPLFVSKHYGKINHVLDHTYAGVFNFLPKKVKKIVTVHDLFQLGGKINNFNFFSVPGIRKADKVIAVSQSTKKDLVNFLKIKEDKIEVIHQGINTNIFKQININKQKYFVNKKIILSVANHEERKNTIATVKALVMLLNKYRNAILIRVGNENESTTKYIKAMSVSSKVIYFKSITDATLVKLYNIADVFVYPSLYEGFGLPVLEAMACGCPVITSYTSSLPEVVGDAGITINPYDVNDLATAIDRVFSNKTVKKIMSKKGIKQTQKFSWEKTAKETFELYNSL